jgi:hypothetical protein
MLILDILEKLLKYISYSIFFVFLFPVGIKIILSIPYYFVYNQATRILKNGFTFFKLFFYAVITDIKKNFYDFLAKLLLMLLFVIFIYMLMVLFLLLRGP